MATNELRIVPELLANLASGTFQVIANDIGPVTVNACRWDPEQGVFVLTVSGDGVPDKPFPLEPPTITSDVEFDAECPRCKAPIHYTKTKATGAASDLVSGPVWGEFPPCPNCGARDQRVTETELHDPPRWYYLRCPECDNRYSFDVPSDADPT
jgi:hypothetical protein